MRLHRAINESVLEPIVKVEPGAYKFEAVSQPRKLLPVFVGATGKVKVDPYIVSA